MSSTERSSSSVLPEVGWGNIPPSNGSAALPLPSVRRDGPSPRPSRRWRGLAVVLGFTFAVVGVGWNVGWRGSQREIPVPPQQSASVVGLGTVLPVSGVRMVAAPFGSADARVARLEVSEGQRVEQGVVLAVLDNWAILRAAVDSARAELDARQTMRGQTASSVSASRAELDAQLARARTAADDGERQLARTRSLYERGATTAHDLEQRTVIRDEALREVERVQASRSRYGSGSVHSQSDTLVATRNIGIAKAALERANAELEKAYVRAPLTGTVLTIHCEPGEKPGNDGILTLGNLERMKVEVDVYQSLIGRVASGDQARVRSTAAPGEWHGVVTQLGLEVRRQRTMAQDPAANTDARVVTVTVLLDEASSQMARGLTNLQVTVQFLPAGRN